MITKPRSRQEAHELNQASIAIPKSVTLDDGREIKITRWTPTVATDDLPFVIIEGYIALSAAQVSEISHRNS